MNDLSFKYETAPTNALTNVSLRVKRGEAVGLVGPSGSGKSTLIDVLLGLLAPASGAVLAGGINVQDRIRWWQDQIGQVPQSIFLTDDTLRRNVAFGLPKDPIDDDAVKSAIRSAQLEEFVASLPEGLNTIVVERGVRLSGGQRQRIGIARALYNNPDMLGLDEATSSLDTETEHGVMQAVQALQGNKTVIIVAHRLGTVEYCDRLYRLENARIVDEGTFSEVTSRTKDLPRDNLMKQLINSYAQRLAHALTLPAIDEVQKLAEAFRVAWKNKQTIYICGNGGSAGNANHLANDFTYGAGVSHGIGLRIESLSANPAVITCLANDLGYENIYSEQLRVKANAGDVLVVFSGSGNSQNVVRALEMGNSLGMHTFAVLGYSGGSCKSIAKYPIHFAIDDMQIAEDLQLIIGHMIMQHLNDQGLAK